MKYRKKPIEIEAVQWLGNAESWASIMDMGDINWKPGEMGTETFTIETLEGDCIVRNGEFVIKGSSGEFYPCEPDIFMLTHEEVRE